MSSLPKVLLLGDSIRLSYQPFVCEALVGKAQVVAPKENCQFSLYTLASLDRWLEDLGKPDMVHWNNGLHDCGHNPRRNPIQIPIEMYIANLQFILKRLRELTLKVIWATTTPVHPYCQFDTNKWSWRNSEIDKYNEAARELMDKYNVPVNDLHSLVLDKADEYLSEDHLHLSEVGQKDCAEAVIDIVGAYMQDNNRGAVA